MDFFTQQFGNSENASKRLEEEIQSLKKRLDEKTQQYLKVWERDFHLVNLIDDVLEKPELKHALKVMNIIKQGLNVPDDFKAPTANKEEVEQLTKEIDKMTKEVELLSIEKQNNDAKSREIDNKIKNLNDIIADLQAESKKSEKELADLKTFYEKKMTELMWKNDKLAVEKEFRKFQLKKHQENTIIVNKENDKENQSQDKVQKLLMDNARLEGKLINKDKELKVVWEKVEFYRNQLNK